MTRSNLLRHVEACNRFDASQYRPFTITGHAIGHVRPVVAELLLEQRLATANGDGIGIDGGGFRAVSERLARIADAIAAAGIVRLRGEMFPVLTHWGGPVKGEIDRACMPVLGFPAFGVHVNGFVRTVDGLHLWVGRRARDREVAPGKLDHLVAGGLPMGLTARETLIKEAGEEAGLAPEIVEAAVATGLVCYRLDLPEGVRHDTLFTFDLELAPGVIPANCDGEVERFELWSVARVIETLRETDDFKFNVPLVLIDFLIRHGVLGPDNEPGYAELVAGLRR